MRKLNHYLTRMLIVILGLAAAACDKDDDDELTTADLLVGTWTTSQIIIDASVGAQSLTDYLINVVGLSPTDAAVQNGLFETALKSELTGSITFNADGTYTSGFGGGSDSGTWSLSPDEQTLTLYEGISDEIVLTIISISGNTLVASIAEGFLEDLDNDGATPDVNVMVEAEVTLM